MKIYKPGDRVPYDPKQLDALCKPELIYPSDLMEDEDWNAKGYNIFLVRDGIPIGILLAYVKNPEDAEGRYMYLAILCVSDAERGQKLAGRLLNELEKVTQSKSIKTIQLSAIPGKKEFYERHGYSSLEDESEKEEDEYTAMEKKLGGRRGKRTARLRRKFVTQKHRTHKRWRTSSRGS